jgi:Ger(x)C family germination protein
VTAQAERRLFRPKRQEITVFRTARIREENLLAGYGKKIKILFAQFRFVTVLYFAAAFDNLKKNFRPRKLKNNKKKKRKIPKMFKRKKGIIFFILLSFFVVLSANIKNVDLNKRAIIIGLGVDRTVDMYELTIQTYVAKQLSDSSPDASKALTVSAAGRTVGEAAAALNVKTGKTLSFALCYVVIFGAGAAEGGIMDAIDFLINKSDTASSAALLYTGGTAKDIMKIESPINASGMLLAHDMLSDKRNKNYDAKTLKDFYADYFSRSAASVMPVLRKTEGGRDEESNNDSENDREKKEYYEISSLAVFKKDKFAFETDAGETAAFSMLSGGKARSVFSADLECGRVTFEVAGKRLREKYVMGGADGGAAYRAEIKLSLKVSEIADGERTAANVASLTRGEKNAAAERLKADMLSLIEKCGASGADILFLNDKFYRRFGNKWKTETDGDYFSNISKEISVKIETV